LKIAIVNKFFYLKGGQDTVAIEEMQLLEKAGHEVAFFSMKHPNNPKNYKWEEYFADYVEFSNSGKEYNFLQKLLVAKNFIFNNKAAEKFEKFILAFKPDVIHCHGIAHQLTYSILIVAKKHKIPVVQTLHDCQTVCPNYLLMLKGKERCDQKCSKYNYFPCIVNKCVKNSMSASILSSVEMFFNHNILNYTQYIDKFIAPSQFLANLVIKSGMNKEKVQVIPNCLTDIEKISPNFENKDYFIFAGRLSFEKGAFTILKAFKDLPEQKLLIAGTGPLEEELKQYKSANNMNNIEFLGYVDRKLLPEYIKDSKGLIIPSECYENCPMSIIEAYAYGKPVIGADVGGIPEMITNDINGYVFEVGNIVELKQNIVKLERDKDKQKILGQNAYDFALKNFNSEKHINSLINLYKELLGS
jgi:glycosyltransferase involved in cell wall biosynthesis